MFYRVFCASFVVLLIVGCSSDGDNRRQEYLNADYYKRLELPPDLTVPDSSRQLVSPRPTAEAMDRFKKDSAEVGKFESNIAVVHVGIKVKGARLQSSDGVLSLEIDDSAEVLWPQLSAFWSYEGIEIIRQEKLLGFMETDWSSQLHLEKEAGFFRRMMNNLDPTKVDKFRMRIEPEGASKIRVYISHLGREMVGDSEDTTQWQARGSEVELEREMLTRLALYVGIDEKQSSEVLANYRPFASRVRVPQDNVNVLYLTGTIDSAWSRMLHAIDRSGVDVLDKNEGAHQAKVVIGKITDEQLGLERDELSESSWLMQWFRNEPSEDYKDDAKRQFNIKLTKQETLMRIEILTLDNEVPDSTLAEQLRKSLALELR